MRRLPPLGAIEAFVAVARSGSIKSAADSLALSSSAVSRRVQTLESHLGSALFERRHQALVLTASGTALLDSLAPALDSLGDALDQVTRPVELPRLRLGVMPLFASHLLLPRIPAFVAANRGFHLDLETTSKPYDELGNRLDAAIWLAESPDPRFYARQLTDNRIVAIAAPALAERIRVPADLKGHTIFLHRDMPRILDVWLDHQQLPLIEDADITLYDSGHLMLDAVAAGLGVAFHLDSLVADDERVTRLFDADAASPYNYWFLCRKSALEQRPVRLFHDWLIGQFAQ